MSIAVDDPQVHTANRRRGLLNAVLAFGWWGLVFPLLIVAVGSRLEYLGHVGPGRATQWDWSLEFLCHRSIWALVTCLVLIAWQGRWPELERLLRSRRSRWLLAVTAVLILGNWVGFVYGAASGRLSHASLGYYINPLFSVALGVVVLAERLRPVQMAAIALAAAGVAWETYRLGQLPWISLLVAGSFGLYGLLRKQISAAAIPGLTVETLLLLPLAVGYLVWREAAGPTPAFGRDALITLLLLVAGVATAAPLIWFANAAKQLPLSTVAFLQFIVPTGQLVTAVTLNNEQLRPMALVSFGLIWLGVAAFLMDIRIASHQRAGRSGATLTEY